jgi:hypothetical protein
MIVLFFACGLRYVKYCYDGTTTETAALLALLAGKSNCDLSLKAVLRILATKTVTLCSAAVARV